MIFLSHILNENTPTYGDRNKFVVEKKSDMDKGDVANDTHITTTVHIGTHIDMPYHFYKDGQTIESYDADFWVFKTPLVVEVYQDEVIIKEKLLDKLKNIDDRGYDILIVKTGSDTFRNQKRFVESNYGFHPDIYDYLVEHFQSIRVIGFDSISVSSFSDRMLGRESHKRFLNPSNPILLLEDMKLDMINEDSQFKTITIAPLRISKCDGLPCTVIGELND